MTSRLVNNIGTCRSENSTHLSLERDSKTLSDSELANAFKRFFARVNSDILPLDLSLLEAFLSTGYMLPMIQSYEVCKKLTAIQPQKVHGPDNIPSGIFKEIAFELATPAGTILMYKVQPRQLELG